MAKSNHNDVWDAIKELTARQIKTDEQINKLAEDIGNGLGNISEGMFADFAKKFARYKITNVYHNAGSELNGMEIDILADGRSGVLPCEVKTRLQINDVKKYLEKKLPNFAKYFPTFKGKPVIGVMAGVKLDKGVADYGERNGIYVMSISGDTIKILNGKNFKPKYF